MFEKIAIIVPTYNRKEITCQFIQRIKAQNYQIKIYVCDSGSSDGTVEALLNISGIEIVHAGATAWWSAAVNRGIERALSNGCDAVLIMNDDIAFDDELISKILEKHLECPSAIISPLQESPSGPFLGFRYIGRTKRMEILKDAKSDVLVHTTNGCCLLVPTALFSTVGLIDEVNCPHQYGDTEFQLRARKYGFQTVACPSIKIVQLGATNYYSKLKLGSMLTFSGSPLHFRAYSQFGRSLFGNHICFLLLGMKYHYLYVKTLLKALLHIAITRARSTAST